MAKSERPLTIIIRNNDGTSNDITIYSNDGKLPTTIEIGSIIKTTEVTESETEVTNDDSSTLVDSSKDDLESQILLKKANWTHIYITIQQILTALCSLVTSGIMIMTLVKFFSTAHIAGAWPTDPKLYPTYILLTVSLLSLCIDILHLGARYCGSSSARKADLMVSKMRYAILVIQAIASATGTGVFNGTKNAGSGQDLFGWTCSPTADQFSNVNSSDLVCNSNTSSSYISIAQTSLHALGIIITILNMLRPKEPNTADSKAGQGNGLKAPLNNTQTKLSASTGSGKPSDAAKPSATDKPEKPAGGEASESDDNTEPEEPQPDTDAIASLIKQSQALYRRLNTNDQTDFRQNDQQDQTGYADVDINSRQADYSDYDIQGLR